MNVFNLISAGGGSGSGLYLWKKFELKWILEDTTLGYGGNIIYENVDRCIVYKSRTPKAENGKVVFESASVALDTTTSNGVYIANDLHNEYFMYAGDDEKAFYVSSSESQYPGYIEYSASSKKVTIRAGSNASYPLHILSPKLTAGDLIGYVISDKEDTYPDGAEQGGFYYAKVNSELKFAEGSLTAATSGAITIPHGLSGEVVAFAVVGSSYARYYTDAVVYPAFSSSNSEKLAWGITHYTTANNNGNGLFRPTFSDGSMSLSGNYYGMYNCSYKWYVWAI